MAGSAAVLARGGCLAAAALLLSGCGKKDNGGDTPSPEATTVLLMRHCARSTYESGITDDEQLKNFDDYSKEAWPKFDVPAMHCLKRGEEVVEQTGAWYKEHGKLPSPVSVVADDCQRDFVTGQALLRGLGLAINDETFVTDAGPFSSQASNGTKECPTFTLDERNAIIEDQLKKHPLSADLQQLIQQTYELAGQGKAGNWSQSTCELTTSVKEWWAPLKGACNVAAEFAERFLMESAGGLDLAWGKLKAEDVPKLLALHNWYLKVSLFAPGFEKRRMASIAWAILEALEKRAPGTRAFVGHDSDQGGLNAILDLTWSPSPWPQNGTMPGSALRFDLEPGSDTVKVSFVFVEDFTKGGGMKSVPANVGDYPQGTVSLSSLRKLVEENTVAACRTDKPGAMPSVVV